MKPMDVWSVISPLIPMPDITDRGYKMWIEVYTTIYIALKTLEEKEQRNDS